MKRIGIRLGYLLVLFVLLQGLILQDGMKPDPARLSEAEIRHQEDQRIRQLLPVQLLICSMAGLSAFLVVSIKHGDPGQMILLEQMADRLDRQECRVRELEDRILCGKKRAEQIGHQMKTKLGSMALYADLCAKNPEVLETL